MAVMQIKKKTKPWKGRVGNWIKIINDIDMQ